MHYFLFPEAGSLYQKRPNLLSEKRKLVDIIFFGLQNNWFEILLYII
jgi:hypothetical protein